jgi:hypothetical protein
MGWGSSASTALAPAAMLTSRDETRGGQTRKLGAGCWWERAGWAAAATVSALQVVDDMLSAEVPSSERDCGELKEVRR